jgi:hypothetical protein
MGGHRRYRRHTGGDAAQYFVAEPGATKVIKGITTDTRYEPESEPLNQNGAYSSAQAQTTCGVPPAITVTDLRSIRAKTG